MKLFLLLVLGLIGCAIADPPVNSTVEVRINCGSKKNFIDAEGNLWIKDTYFQGGGEQTTPFVEIRDTVDDELYRTSRLEWKYPWRFGLWEQIKKILQGGRDVIGLAYNIPVNDGDFYVRLHFTENKHTSFEGYRNFDVLMEDKVVLKGIDLQEITDEVPFTAITRSAFTNVTDGELNIVFQTNIDRSVVMGIEVFRLPVN